MQSTCQKTPRTKGTGSVRRFANKMWQSSFSRQGDRYYIEAVSRDEAEAKLNIALKLADSGGLHNKDDLHRYLISKGFPSGIKRTAISSYNINKTSPSCWRASLSIHGEKYRIAAVSEEEAKAKFDAFQEALMNGEFENSDDSLDAILKNAGFPAGRLHSLSRKRKNSKAHGRFVNGIRLRFEGYYEGRYYYNRKPESVYALTKKEVVKKLTAIKASLNDGSYTGKNNETFVGCFMSWIKFSGQTVLRPSTQRKYTDYVINHLIPHFGSVRLQDVTTDMLQKFFTLKTTEGRADGKEGGLSHKTLTDMRNMLRKGFNYAINPKKYISNNPSLSVSIRYRSPKAIPIIPPEEMDFIIQKAFESDNPIGWATVILLRTGIRRGELLGLKLDKIQMRNGTITIDKSLCRMYHPNKEQALEYERLDTWGTKKTKTGMYLGPPKTSSSCRQFPFGKQVKECIEKLIAYQENLLRHPINQCAHNGDDNFLMVNELLRPYDPRTFWERFKKFLESIEVEGITVHSTRHSFTTDILARFPEELPTISEIVGHADKSTTLKYTHGANNKKKTLMDSF